MKYANVPPFKQVQEYFWNPQARLGSGSCGTVFLGHDSKRSGDPKGDLVAIKVIRV